METTIVKTIIAYYRVSTAKQGKSGLGLEGQQQAVELYASQNGAKIVASYREVETGKRADRPELVKALAHARRHKATVVIAKLDRLARNVAFTSALMDSGADFVCCDNPHANRFTLHILAAVAEHEAKMISDRTKAALQAVKARGVKLGSARPNHWKGREKVRRAALDKGRLVASKVLRQQANEAYTDLYGLLNELRAKGQTLQQIANELTAMGHTTRRGKQWNASQVMRVLRRAS